MHLMRKGGKLAYSESNASDPDANIFAARKILQIESDADAKPELAPSDFIESAADSPNPRV